MFRFFQKSKRDFKKQLSLRNSDKPFSFFQQNQTNKIEYEKFEFESFAKLELQGIEEEPVQRMEDDTIQLGKKC